MSRGLFIGVIVLTLLSVGVYWSEKAKTAEDAKPAPDAAPKLVALNAGQMERISIERKGAEPVVLERVSGKWRISQPSGLRADEETVSSLAGTLTDLRWERLVEEKPSSVAEFGLAEPAVQVAYGGKGAKPGKLLIGDETPTGGNYYAKLDGDARVFTLNSGSKSSIDRTAQDLRDKRLLPLDGEKSIEVTSQWRTVELSKPASGDWRIVKPQPMRADGFQVEELLRRLREARMDEAKIFFGGLRPVATVKVTDASGAQQVEIRQSGADKSYYARSSAVEGIHKVAEDLGKSFETGVEAFKNKKLFDFGFNDPSKVEVYAPAESWTFVKSGDKWWLKGKEMDPAGTQILIDKLRDLTATQLSSKSPGAATVTIAVTSDGGKKVERVPASPSGSVYLARRENEPVVFELTAASVQDILSAAKDVKPAGKK